MFEVDLVPSEPMAEVTYLGFIDEVTPDFNEDNWDHIGTVKAEKTHFDEGWHYSTEITKEIEPMRDGFWMWGDRLVRVCMATILESNLLVFKRKDVDDAETQTTG